MRFGVYGRQRVGCGSVGCSIPLGGFILAAVLLGRWLRCRS